MQSLKSSAKLGHRASKSHRKKSKNVRRKKKRNVRAHGQTNQMREMLGYPPRTNPPRTITAVGDFHMGSGLSSGSPRAILPFITAEEIWRHLDNSIGDLVPLQGDVIEGYSTEGINFSNSFEIDLRDANEGLTIVTSPAYFAFALPEGSKKKNRRTKRKNLVIQVKKDRIEWILGLMKV